MTIEFAERKDTKDVAEQRSTTGTASVTPEPVESPSHYGENDGATAALMTAGAHKPSHVLLDAKNVQALRAENLQQNLRSNFWFETAGLLRWATIGLLATSLGAIFTHMLTAGAAVGGAAGAAAGGAVIGLPVIAGLLTLAVVTGAAMVYSSQKSRKIFVERTFDVQDFNMQRQAALIGKSVEQATEQSQGMGKTWADRFEQRGTTENWAQAVSQQAPAELSAAQR